MNGSLKIGDLVEIPPVQTVIHLDDGRQRSVEIVDSFVFTQEVSAHVAVFADALLGGAGQGYFLVGDFGSGKSHFLAAMYSWLAAAKGPNSLSEKHGGLRRVREAGKTYLPVDISLVTYRSTTPLEQIVLDSVVQALRARELDAGDLGSRGEERGKTFLSMIEAVTSRGFDGLVFLIDELSEFFRSKPSARDLNEDARTLQLLGEMSGDNPLWIIAAVQESIERTGDIAAGILRKIKDRFPVQLSLSTVHIRSLISERLVRRKQGADEEIYRIHDHYRRQFHSFDVPFESFSLTYPVHPSTIALLEGLGDLFSQHRGIVDFVYSRLAGDSRRHIDGILDRPATELLAPDSIYDHFSQRIGEISAFHVFPRHIVPHFDQIIETVLDDEEDRYLARRLVRMLVLYRIHPTANEPTVSLLTELAACSPGFHSAELNARFVAETILDPIAEHSRFLSKQPSPSGTTEETVYRIVTEEDPGKVLAARIARVAGDLLPDDSRLILKPLSELPESDSWPGMKPLLEGLTREIGWNTSMRKVLIRFVDRADGKVGIESLSHEVEESGADFGLVFILGSSDRQSSHTAVWQIAVPTDTSLLTEYLAAHLVGQELKPSNPSHAPLIPLLEERLQRQRMAVQQKVLEAVYAGEFADPLMRLDPAVRQLRRFDRLLESAGEVILASRYPRFPEVAPRMFVPSLRIYQQLLDDFVIPGSLSITEARSRALNGPIDGLVVPLGLVELRRGAYVYSPDANDHPLLAHFFGLLSATSAVELNEILKRLRYGPFGLPEDTSHFLLAALAAGGLISILRGNRTIPLQFLNMGAVQKATAVSLGELINERDRTTLVQECTFLTSSSEWASFGLRQQRDAWKELVKFRDTAQVLLEDTRRRVTQISEYASFQGFLGTDLKGKLEALEAVLRGISVSLPAKEGLEKFVQSWRGTGMHAEDVVYVKDLNRFLTQNAEQFIFYSHYVNHSTVEALAAEDSAFADLRERVLERIRESERVVSVDGFREIKDRFEVFRQGYVAAYERMHDEHYRSLRMPTLSKSGVRALSVLRGLSSIEGLDRPSGLTDFLRRICGESSDLCRRIVREELLRSPVCGCGFQPGGIPEHSQIESPEKQIDTYLRLYTEVLGEARVRESIAARSFALSDVDPDGAKYLGELKILLSSTALNNANLVKALDAATIQELSRALSDRTPVHRRDVGQLTGSLAGRRLPEDRILELVRDWIGGHEDGAIISAELGDADRERNTVDASSRHAIRWWRLSHRMLFDEPANDNQPRDATDLTDGAQVSDLSRALEREYPAATLKTRMERLQSGALLDFISQESFHTAAIRQAWLALAEKTIRNAPFPVDRRTDSQHADSEEAARIRKRLAELAEIEKHRRQGYPERLAVRAAVQEVQLDPWSTSELVAEARRKIEQIEVSASEWGRGLQPLPAIALEERPLVLVVDGVPADVWLKNIDLITSMSEHPRIEWSILQGDCRTAAAMTELFGLSVDPSEAFAVANVPYIQLRGDEAYSAADSTLPLSPGSAAVIRLSIVDQAAHRGMVSLSDMAQMLRVMLDRNLEPFLAACHDEGRPIVLTTDHGLSIHGDEMSHGGGKAFERIIFRASWSFPR